MKKFFAFFLLIAVAGSCLAMSRSKIRKHARFLTDRMAYELELTPYQYDDCYEINYDFLWAINGVGREMSRGYPDAIDFYYHCLDLRNEDLHYVLSNIQFTRFMAMEHFYRPIYTTGSKWSLRVYTVYTDHSLFYNAVPTCYRTYRGEHSRIYHTGGFYVSRYVDNPRYQGSIRLTGSQGFDTYRRNDFGTTPVRRQSSFSYDTYDAPNRTTRNQSYRQGGTRQTNTQNQRTQQSGQQQRTQQGARQGSTQSTTSRRGTNQSNQRTQQQQTQPSTTTSTATSGRRGVTQSQQTQQTQRTQQQQSQPQQTQQSQPQQSTGTRQNGNTGSRGGRR